MSSLVSSVASLHQLIESGSAGRFITCAAAAAAACGRSVEKRLRESKVAAADVVFGICFDKSEKTGK